LCWKEADFPKELTTSWIWPGWSRRPGNKLAFISGEADVFPVLSGEGKDISSRVNFFLHGFQELLQDVHVLGDHAAENAGGVAAGVFDFKKVQIGVSFFLN